MFYVFMFLLFVLIIAAPIIELTGEWKQSRRKAAKRDERITAARLGDTAHWITE